MSTPATPALNSAPLPEDGRRGFAVTRVSQSGPKRIQLSRRKGWRMPPNCVKVDRSTKWGNPFVVGDDVPGLAGTPMDAEDAVHAFEVLQAPMLNLAELRGKNLACWCRPGAPCHADVLLRLANTTMSQPGGHPMNDQKTEAPTDGASSGVALATGSVVWTTSAFQSGTQVVQRNYSAFEAYYHIGHLAADTEGDGGRFDVARELCDWLNGGAEPWWLDMLRRTSADTVTLPHGCEITATGPMIDLAEPPSWGNWAQDDRDDARIARGLLADALMKRHRPSPNDRGDTDAPLPDAK